MVITQGNERGMLPMQTCLQVGLFSMMGSCDGKVGSFGIYHDTDGCSGGVDLDGEELARETLEQDGEAVLFEFHHCGKQSCDDWSDDFRQWQSSGGVSSISVEERQNSVSGKFKGLLSVGLVAAISMAVCMV